MVGVNGVSALRVITRITTVKNATRMLQNCLDCPILQTMLGHRFSYFLGHILIHTYLHDFCNFSASVLYDFRIFVISIGHVNHSGT